MSLRVGFVIVYVSVFPVMQLRYVVNGANTIAPSDLISTFGYDAKLLVLLTRRESYLQ